MPVVSGFSIAWTEKHESTGPVEVIVSADHVIVAGAAGPISAYARQDGKIRWTITHGASVSPAVAGDIVYVANGPTVGAYSAATGEPRWSAEHPQDIAALSATAAGVIVVAGDVVRYLAAADGKQQWAQRIERASRAAPVVREQTVFLTPAPGVIAAWSLETGATLRSVPLGIEIDRFFVSRNRLYAAAVDEGFFVIDPDSGWIDWQLARAKVIGVPAVGTDRLYLTLLDHTLVAYDHGGSREWVHSLGGRPVAGPVLSGETLIVALTTAEMAAVNSRSGERIRAVAKEAPSTTLRTSAFGASADGSLLALLTVSFGEQRTLTAYTPASPSASR